MHKNAIKTTKYTMERQRGQSWKERNVLCLPEGNVSTRNLKKERTEKL